MPRTATMFDDPTYVVLNIPAPAADIVKDIRRRFDPDRADYPVEISVSGSNGIGSIIEGQDSVEVFAAIDRIAADLKPFSTSFREIRQFENTGIFYFTMAYPEKFVEIHDMVVSSGIWFTPNRFPYEPHCTICLNNATLTESDVAALCAIKPPQEEFIINTISVYELNSVDDGQLLHRCNFGGNH